MKNIKKPDKEPIGQLAGKQYWFLLEWTQNNFEELMTDTKSTAEDKPIEVYDLSEAQETFASDDYNNLGIELIPNSRKSKLKWKNDE